MSEDATITTSDLLMIMNYLKKLLPDSKMETVLPCDPGEFVYINAKILISDKLIEAAGVRAGVVAKREKKKEE